VAIVDLLYFGTLRDALGRDGERVDPPSHVLTVADLIGWLEARGEPYATAMAEPAAIAAAVDREHAAHDDSFFGAREVALFPSVSGL
jgi:molybdopterin synthase sulfur carrier subunit